MKHAAALTLILAVAAAGCSPEEGTAPVKATMPFAIERLSESYEGTAREVLQVSSYTYVAVESEQGTRWSVSLRKDISEGARVKVRAFGKKNDFASKQLARTFPELWFGIITQQQQGEQS